MGNRPGRVRAWVRRYLLAELVGLTTALASGVGMSAWSGANLALVAYAAAIGEGVGFYAGFLIMRYLREEIDGPPRRRIAVILAAAVVEFGPAEILDTVLVRPAAMYLGSWGSGNVVVGVLIGKVTADVVFYGVAITSYEVVVRRFLHRFRRPIPGPATPAPKVSPRTTPQPGPPVLVMDLAEVTRHYRRLTAALPGVAVHFAVKCNPDPPLLRHLDGLGCQFEVASWPELETLLGLGVRPADVIFSNPVKPWWHVRDAYAAGVRRFGADSDAELTKLATHAPGAAVLVRLAVDPTASAVPSEGKFGVDADQVRRLLEATVDHGLRPYGIAFHVGSQMSDPRAWTAPIRDAGMVMRRLHSSGIRVASLDIGGGFPADYGSPVPSIEAYGDVIMAGLADLPYEVEVVAEPGRGLVADAGRLETTVIGVAERHGRRWAHLDVGAFNGGMEALETAHGLVLPMTDTRGGPRTAWVVTGPSCDSQDTLRFDAALSADLQTGDRVLLHTAGAYTTAYASSFNGFDVPVTTYRSGVSAPTAAVEALLART